VDRGFVDKRFRGQRFRGQTEIRGREIRGREAVKKLPPAPIQSLLLMERWQYTTGNEQTTASSSPGFD
jgi:hypothetical protein